jgi:hypothetical protein
MRFRITALAAVAAFALSSPAAQAGAVSASISISDLKYQLTDLTPNDGQAANVDMWTLWPEVTSWAGSDYHDVTGGAGNLTATSSAGGGSASASLTHSTLTGEKWQSRLLNNSVQAISPVAGQYEQVGSAAKGDGSLDLLIYPHTTLVITGHITAEAQFAPVANHAGSIYIFINAGIGGGTGGIHQELTLTDADPAHYSFSQDFTLSFVNNTAYYYSPTFANQTQVIVDNQPSTMPVPEPSSYAMLGVGLAVMGALARKRKQVT